LYDNAYPANLQSDDVSVLVVRSLPVQYRAMIVRTYQNAADWLNAVAPALSHAEAENNLLLGLGARAVEDPSQFPGGLLLASVADGGSIIGAALSIPPRVLIVSRMAEAALTALAEHLAQAGLALPGVVGPEDTPAEFASLWSQRTGTASHVYMRQMIYSNSKVCWSQRAAGQFRPAAHRDVSQLARWWLAFNVDVGNRHISDDPESDVRTMIDTSRLFVWEDRGAVVAFVYTPPEQRGHGYATSCVAELTDRELRAGRQFCCLYTDLANPTSNAIYARIGYRPVCGSEWWEFAEG
jgi:predicted GNAT family acetyltransferase